MDLLAPQIEPGTDPKSQVRCNPWCCQRLVVQRYTNRPASFLKSSHLPYKLKSPSTFKCLNYRGPSHGNFMSWLGYKIPDPTQLTLPENWRFKSQWKENCIEINSRTIGECKQLFLCFLWFIQYSSAIKLSFVVNVQMRAQWCKWMDEYEWVNHYILFQEVYWITDWPVLYLVWFLLKIVHSNLLKNFYMKSCLMKFIRYVSKI